MAAVFKYVASYYAIITTMLMQTLLFICPSDSVFLVNVNFHPLKWSVFIVSDFIVAKPQLNIISS